MKSGDLNVKINIPATFDQNNLIMVFKLKTNKKVFVGPTLVLFVKIVPTGEVSEISSFDDGSFQAAAEPMPQQNVKNDLVLLNKGIDVYTEP